MRLENKEKKLEEIISKLENGDFEKDAITLTDSLKPYINNYIIEYIEALCDGTTNIKENYYDGCPYDYSGRIKDTGEFLGLDNTVKEVLCNYTGQSRATYISHYGLDYFTYQNDLNQDIEFIAEDIVRILLDDYIDKGIVENYRLYCEDDWADCIEEFICNMQHSLDIEWIDILDFDEDKYQLQQFLFDVDVETPVREFVKLKQELPDNPIWNKIMNTEH